MIFIIGGEGFVGSAFLRYFKKHKIVHKTINRKNYTKFIGKKCKILINANGNSKKYLADTKDFLDFKLSTISVKKTLLDFNFESYIYLSSAEVYSNSHIKKNTKEDKFINSSKISTYALHKYLSELLISNLQNKNWWIFRLSGMVGENLKKNPIYDIIKNKNLRINSKSKLQYINTDDVVKIIMKVSNKKNSKQIFNIAGKGLMSIDRAIKLSKKKLITNSSLQIIKQNINTNKIEKKVNLPKTINTIKKFVIKNNKH
jgi:nucleoside-diphosphate-sugar epimerase